jgi:hypothetical protein
VRYCERPSHIDPSDPQLPWIMDDGPDHEHEKPRYKLVNGEWLLIEQENR